MPKIQPTTRDEARAHAIEWQQWASGEDLYMSELVEWQAHFTAIAEQFGLTEEFIENGII